MKPILFNGDMVRAILDGRKTVTRRIIKLQNPSWSGYIPEGNILYGSNNIPAATAPYKPGDILYVREAWRKEPDRYMYRANYSDTEKFYQGGNEIQIKWKPSIHMPKEAARLFLRVVSVRAERIKNMTVHDVYREGIEPSASGLDADTMDIWKNLWNRTLNTSKDVWEEYSWYSNPWVWAIEFERCDQPEEV